MTATEKFEEEKETQMTTDNGTRWHLTSTESWADLLGERDARIPRWQKRIRFRRAVLLAVSYAFIVGGALVLAWGLVHVR